MTGAPQEISTLNFGLRYEFSSVSQEARQSAGQFRSELADWHCSGGNERCQRSLQSDHKNFAPRFGFAWDMTGKGKTVLSGGGGLIYETINWESLARLQQRFRPLPTFPPERSSMQRATLREEPSRRAIWQSLLSFHNGIAVCLCTAPMSAPATPNCFNNPCPIMTVDRNITTPYVWNWTLNLQHAFTPNLSLEVAYVGNHGSNLTGIRDINQPPVGIGLLPLPAVSTRSKLRSRMLASVQLRSFPT